MSTNPFTPYPGQEPFALAGTHIAEEKLRSAIMGDEAERVFYRKLLVTGHHGSGKTAILRRFGQIADAVGWAVVSVRGGVRAYGELLDDTLPELLAQNLGSDEIVNLRGERAYRSGFDAGDVVRGPRTVRQLLRMLASAKAEVGAGVLVLVDDAHRWGSESFQQLFLELATVCGPTPNVVLVAAGTPELHQLALAKSLPLPTVGERWIQLGKLGRADTADLLRRGFELAECAVGPRELELLTDVSGEFPALVQSIGFEVVRAQQRGESMSMPDLESALAVAFMVAGRLYHSRTIREAEPAAVRVMSEIANLAYEVSRDSLSLTRKTSYSSLNARGIGPQEQLREVMRWMQDRAYINVNAAGQIEQLLPGIGEFLLVEERAGAANEVVAA